MSLLLVVVAMTETAKGTVICDTRIGRPGASKGEAAGVCKGTSDRSRRENSNDGSDTVIIDCGEGREGVAVVGL